MAKTTRRSDLDYWMTTGSILWAGARKGARARGQGSRRAGTGEMDDIEKKEAFGTGLQSLEFQAGLCIQILALFPVGVSSEQVT